MCAFCAVKTSDGVRPKPHWQFCYRHTCRTGWPPHLLAPAPHFTCRDLHGGAQSDHHTQVCHTMVIVTAILFLWSRGVVDVDYIHLTSMWGRAWGGTISVWSEVWNSVWHVSASSSLSRWLPLFESPDPAERFIPSHFPPMHLSLRQLSIPGAINNAWNTEIIEM